MKPSEAVRMVGLLQAAWPSRDFTQDTGSLYAAEIVGFEVVDAEPAIRWLIRTELWCPTVAQVVAGITDRRRIRADNERSANRRAELASVSETQAVSLADWLADNPDEAAKVLRLRRESDIADAALNPEANT
ncbi:MAG: hypothetical protein WEA81_00825 [Dehalococcoidia bacterium]